MALALFAHASARGQNPAGSGGPLPGGPATAVSPPSLNTAPPQLKTPPPTVRATPPAGSAATTTPPAAATSPPPPPANPAPPAPKPDRVYRPTLDKSKGFIGDLFTWTVQIAHDPNERVLFPAEPSFAPFEVRGRDFFKRTLDDGKVEETFVFKLAVYKVGSYRTPSIDIPFVLRDGRTLRTVTQEMDVAIESLLPAGPSLPPLKNVKPPLHVIVRDWRLLWAGGILAAVLLLGLIAWLAVRYGKKLAARPRAAPPPPPPRPAHVIAYEKLARVRLPTTEEEQRLFYELVSNIVREYYGNRYGLLALDMTTGEILKILRSLEKSAPGLRFEDVARFLSDADLVKFAKFVPGGEEPGRYLGEARRLVDATRAPDDVPSIVAAHAGPTKKAA